MPKEKNQCDDERDERKKRRIDEAGPSSANQQEETRQSLDIVPGYAIDNVDVYSELFVMSSSRSTVLVVDYRLRYVYAITGGPTEKKQMAPNIIRCATRELRDNRCLGCPKFGIHSAVQHSCGGLQVKDQLDLTFQQLHRFYMCVGHHFDDEFKPEDYSKSYYGTIYSEAFHCCLRWIKRTFLSSTKVTHPVWKYEDDAEGAGSWSFFERSLSSVGSQCGRSIHMSEWESRRHSNAHLELPHFGDRSLKRFWNHLNKEGAFQIWTLCKAKRWLRHRDDQVQPIAGKGKNIKRPVGVVSTGGSANRRGQISSDMWSPVKYNFDKLLDSISKNYDPRPGLSGRGLHLPIYALKEDQLRQPPPGGLPHPPVDVKRYENWARNRYVPSSTASVVFRRRNQQSSSDNVSNDSSSSSDEDDDVIFIREYWKDDKSPPLYQVEDDLVLSSSSDDESDSMSIKSSPKQVIKIVPKTEAEASSSIPNSIPIVNSGECSSPSPPTVDTEIKENQSQMTKTNESTSQESQDNQRPLIPSPPVAPAVPLALIAIADRDNISHFAVQNLITFVDAPDEMADYFFQTIRQRQMMLQERDRRETEQWIEDVKQMRAARNTQLPSTPQTSTEESASGVPPKKNLNFRKSQPER